MIVLKIKLASVKNAKILVSIHVDPMPNVMSSHIRLIAVASKAIKVTHLLAAVEYRNQLLKLEIHVYLHHAEKMLNVRNEMEWQDVLVFHHTLEMLTQLDVDRNVCSTLTVLVTWLASNNTVAIHVEEFVDKTLNVLLSIIFPFALVREVIKAIHLLDVD